MKRIIWQHLKTPIGTYYWTTKETTLKSLKYSPYISPTTIQFDYSQVFVMPSIFFKSLMPKCSWKFSSTVTLMFVSQAPFFDMTFDDLHVGDIQCHSYWELLQLLNFIYLWLARSSHNDPNVLYKHCCSWKYNVISIGKSQSELKEKP